MKRNVSLTANLQENAGETIYANYKNTILKTHNNDYNSRK